MEVEEVEQSLIKAETVGKRLAVSKRQVFRLDSSGRIPEPVRIGASVRWRQSDIQRWIDLDCPDRKTFESMKGNKNGK